MPQARRTARYQARTDRSVWAGGRAELRPGLVTYVLAVTMGAEEERETMEAEVLRRSRRSNRRVLVVVALVTLTVIGWNLYAQFVTR